MFFFSQRWVYLALAIVYCGALFGVDGKPVAFLVMLAYVVLAILSK